MGDDANTRIGQLYTTGVPLPFDLRYACRVDNPDEVEAGLHAAFAPYRLNLRREFFKIEPDQAIAILKLLHHPDATAEISQQPTEVDAESIAAVQQVRARRPQINFTEMGIPRGGVLTFVDKDDVSVTVVSDRKVKLGDDVLSLTDATTKVRGTDYDVRPNRYWMYQGRLLSEIYAETYER